MATLVAHLANGRTALLVDARVDCWEPDQGRITASAAVVGTHGSLLEANLDFKEVEFQVGALDAVSGVRPVKETHFPGSADRRHLEGTWSVQGNPESSLEWSDDDIRVKFSYDSTARVFDGYSSHFSTSPVLRVESNKPLTLQQWGERWVDPARLIVSIATGVAQPLTCLAVRWRSDGRRRKTTTRWWRRTDR